jgi:YbbR domain-containing protein
MMRKGARRWLGFVTENIGYKLLALLAAVALWALVATEPELSTFVNVRVEYKNLPDELELASEPVTSVLLELRGPSGELRAIGDGGQRPAVVLDMSSVTPGRRTFVIDTSNIRLARAVHLVQTTPSELSFTFDRRATRTVPVVVRLTGDGHSGYTAVATRADPPELKIVGPASHVNKITQVETDPVDVSSVFGVKQFRVTATVGDPFVRFDASPQVAVTVTMKKI